MTDAELLCRNCGAPAKPNEVLCDFCSAPVSQGAMQNAVRYPSCAHPVLRGTMECTKCKFVAQCLFCARVSPVGVTQCTSCNEAFVGMKERKAACDRRQRTQQMIQVGEKVAEVALPLVGGGGGLLGAIETLIDDVENS